MIFRFDQFELDEDRYELRGPAGDPIELQPKVMEVLLHLVRNAERTLTKDELLDAVWGDVAITEASLTRCISLARRALGEPDADPRIIQTVRGRGYRIGVAVTHGEADATPAPAAVAEAGAPEPALASRPRVGRAGWVALAAGLVLLGAGAWLARPFHALPLSEPARQGPHPPTAVAVLPFVDLRSADQRSAAAEDLALEVIDELARWPELRVTSFRSSFRFSPAEPVDPAAVGRELGVGTLVTGSLRDGGAGAVEVSIELVETDGGFQGWSGSFRLAADDFAEGRTQVARQVGSALGANVQATNPHQVRRHGVSRERLLRDGRQAVMEANRGALLSLAEGYARALETEPGDLRNRVALAEVYHRLWEHDGEHGGTGDNWLTLAAAEARAALARAPRDPFVLTIVGTIATSRRDWDTAEVALRNALANGGGAYASHRLGVLLLMEGRVEEARAHVARALELDPLSPEVVRGAGRFHLYAGEPRPAVSLLRRTLELDPNDFYAPRLLANAHELLGEEDAAREALVRIMPGFVRPLARIQDRLLGTERTLRTLLAVDILASGLPCRDDPLGTALMWAYLDERDRTFECLEVAARHHLWYIPVEPLMYGYRDDPEFRRIVADAGHTLPIAAP